MKKYFKNIVSSRFCIFLFVSLVILANPKAVFAATYYVSSNGVDSQTGLSADLPWKTIAKVNAALLNPGDQVLFKRGETFAGQLKPTRSGTDVAWITYGAYGSGARPIIDGSASNALYIDGPYVHHLRYENLDFSGAASTATALVYTHSMYFYNDIFRNSAIASGFAAGWGAGQESYNITLDTSEFAYNYKNGALIGSDTGAKGPHDILIKNSNAHHNGHDIYAHHGFYVKFGVTIQDSVAAYNSSAGFKINSESIYTSPYSPTLKNNTAYENNVGIYIGHNKAKIFGNYVYNNTNANIMMDSDADNNEIYANISKNVKNVSGSANFAFQGGLLNTGNYITNNLFIQDRAISPKYLFLAARGSMAEFAANNTIDGNTYYTDGNPNTHLMYDSTGQLFSWDEYRKLAGAPDRTSVFLSQPPSSTVTPSPSSNPVFPGDANGDGYVNEIDYLVWINHYKTSTANGPSDGDFDSNGFVDGVDYVIWLMNHR